VKPIGSNIRSNILAGGQERYDVADGTIIKIPNGFEGVGYQVTTAGRNSIEWRYDALRDVAVVHLPDGRERDMTDRERKRFSIYPGPEGYNDYYNAMAQYQT